MSISHKYRTFNQLYEDVSIDFANYALENMIESQQLIKVATRVNYDLGLRIHRTKEIILDVEHGKVKLPFDFAYLNDQVHGLKQKNQKKSLFRAVSIR